MFACDLLDRLVYAYFVCACLPVICWIVWCMHVSCIDSDVHSCFELRSALSQCSWIRHYIIITHYYLFIF